MPTLFAFLSGAAYLGLQSLLLKKLTVFIDESQPALFVHFYLLFVTILVATYIVEARPSKHPEHWLRRTGLGIVITYGVAFYVVTLCIPEKLSTLACAWLGGLTLTPAAVCSGVAFGKFVQIVLLQHPRTAWAVLCSVGGGALIAPQFKFFVAHFGPTLSFVVFLLSFVAILTILPVLTNEGEEEDQPEVW